MLGSAVPVASHSPAPVLPSPASGWRNQGYPGDSPESQAVSPSFSRKRQDAPEKLGAAAPARHCWSRVPFLTKWINHLCEDDPGWTPMEESNFFEDLKTGIVLCKVVERLVPGVDLTSKGIYQKPRTRATCVANIDKALSVAWRTGVNATNMCSADEIYDGKVTAATRCVSELFEALQMRVREVRTRSREMLISMNARLSPIGCALSKATLNEPYRNCDALVDDFADCTKIMALFVSAGKASVEDLLSLAHREQTARLQGAELDAVLEENGRILSQVLEANGCPVLLAEKEFSRPPAPCPDTLLLQLHFIWRVSLGTPTSPSPDLAASLANTNGSSTWAVSGKANADDLQIWMQLLSTKFASLHEAYWSWCGNMSGRMSQTSFMRSMKELHFQGDAKLVWDTLTRGVPGFLSVEEFARPDLEACFAKIAEANLQGDEERPEIYGEDEEVVAPEEAEEEELVEEEELEAAEVPMERVEMETLLDFTSGPRDINLELIAEACRKLQDEEPRFLSGVEERTRLLHEDLQRQQELLASGAASTARLVAAAAAAASAAASVSLATPTLDVENVHLTPEIPDISRLLEGLETGLGSCNTLEEAIEPINSLLSEFGDDLPAPTTSVDAHVVMSDASELRVSLQTNVVDRPNNAEEVPALILEVWAFEGTDVALPEYQLLAQVDCSQMIDVLQHGPLTGDLMFEILLKPGADLMQVDPRSLAIANTAGRCEGERHGPSELRHRSWLVDTRQQPSLFTSEEEPLDALPTGSLLSMKCSFARAPAWTKLEAARFFDELRILVRFVQPQPEVGDVAAHAEVQKVTRQIRCLTT